MIATRPAFSILVVVVLVFGFFCSQKALCANASLDLSGRWEGEIAIPGMKLEINVDFRRANGDWEGDISIPAQNAKDLPLAKIVWKDTDISFEMPGIPGDPKFKGTIAEAGNRISGDFTQGGKTFPFSLERGAPPETKAEEALEGFDDFIEKVLKDWNVPGLAIGIVIEGEVVFAKGFGKRNIEKDLPVTLNTLFAIGSTTKAFTAFVMGTLVDEGKLDWDKPVADYLPGFRLHDEYATNHITPRDLVTHRSGLPRHDMTWYNNLTTSRDEMVERLRHLEPSRELREKFQYNNLMFMAAGYLVGHLTGGTWEEAVRSRIFNPLGMTNSNFSVTESQKSDDFAMPYREKDDKIEEIPFRNLNLAGPAGSINSCIEDMTRWLIVQLGDGEFQGKRIVKKATCKEFHTPQMTVAALPDEPELSPASYALGWMTDTYRGHYRVHHNGAIDGFVARVTLFPYDRIGIVVLANRNRTPLPGLVTRHTADRLFGLERRDWQGEALARREAMKEEKKKAEGKKEMMRKPGTKPAHPVEAYAGEYEHPGYGVLKIDLKGDRLEMTYNGIVTPLEHWHFETFSALENPDDPAFKDTKLTFYTHAKGNIETVSAPFEPAVDEIVFKRKVDAKLFDPEYLKRFVGEYELAQMTITISLTGKVLTASVPGQPEMELVPDQENEFTVKEVSVAWVRFVTDDEGRVTSVLLSHPGAVVEAKRKK